MTDFLLELRCEEIPARMQAGARASLEKLFREAMGDAGVSLGAITVWSTPRRLALIARDVPLATAEVSEEVKGPRVGAPPQALEGFLRKTGLTEDQLIERDGVLFAVSEKPGRATKDVLAEAIPAIVRAFPWPKSQRWGADSISTESLRWVRPLSGIVALLGDAVIECEIAGISAGCTTLGHRFHHSGPITIGSAGDYQEKLRACHVIVDHAEREALIRDKAHAAALAEGLVLVEDEGLVIENAGLTEWPVPLLGRFDAAFLEVPPEVIQLTARTNQKYFICRTPLPQAGGAGGGPDNTGVAPGSDTPTPNPSRKREGDLANAFVCTANIAAKDGGAAIIDGNRKVLAARLSDARFFWQQDRKKTLAQHAEGLARITFHEKLGTVADKVDRVAKLARWLVEEGIVGSSSPSTCDGEVAARSADGGAPPPLASGERSPSPSQVDGEDQASLAEQAARLCKADLVTEMVGEFPELQGLMGGYYARAEGLPDAVADAIRDHYKPVGQGDAVPTAPVTVAVSLADKLDTLVGFFLHDLKPTGSKDPFALRRAAIGIVATIVRTNSKMNLVAVIYEHAWQFSTVNDESKRISMAMENFRLAQRLKNEFGTRLTSEDYARRRATMKESHLASVREEHDSFITLADQVIGFVIDRLKVQQREAGVRHDLIDAVFALGGEDDLVRLLARVHALQAFIGTEDGTNLLAGYKRAANILKKEDWSGEAKTAIPRDGEEDPFAMVDDPDIAFAMRERIAAQNALSYAPEPAERALMDTLELAEPKAAAAIAAEDFATAMAALASLRAPIDAFFDSVTVNDADPAKRAARLALLERFRVAVHKVADFARIEG